MEYKVKPTDSRIWKAMHKVKSLLLDELSWMVGKGKWIQVFKDNWGPRDFTIQTLSNLKITFETLHHSFSVQELATLSFQGLRWNDQKLDVLWSHKVANFLCDIPLGGQDIPCWGTKPAVKYTLKSLYQPIEPIPIRPHPPWTYLRKINIPSKIKFFARRILFGPH